ncbi:acyltransferase family protein [Actinocatenispora sera]|uniref:acyltransferase family protein n=1 Tax=Actinocatenispora sera TaxID=390989 RepID=UPI00340C395A
MDVQQTSISDDRSAAAPAPAREPAASPNPAQPHRFRPDVEGLRAVAVLAVLGYHAGIARLGGGYVGVDVFFVISGFLITGMLVREAERRGTVSAASFYARRAKRLLPLTVPVLVAVVVASWWVLSPVGGKSVFVDVITAGLYVVNWRLAGQSVDYSALGADASPVQHFWSLAVEEQFYLVWPVVVIAVVLWCRYRHVALRPRLVVALGTLAAASFAYAVAQVADAAGAAYFSTLTRGWELAAGGLLALVPPAAFARVRRFATPAAVLGLAAIAIATVGYSDDTPFPGTTALLPVLGTVAVIAAGTAVVDTAPGRLLSLPPVRYVGRISYSWYLWHWPAIALVTAWLGDLPSSQLAVVVLLSGIPAAISHHLVEDRLRHARSLARPRRALPLGLACTAVSVLVGVGALVAVPTVPLASPQHAIGAKALKHSDGPQRTARALAPVPDKAVQDDGQAQDDHCLVRQKETRTPGDCVYGDPHGDTTVVLYGDSHALQYFAAMDKIAKHRGWRLIALGKAACTPAQVSTYNYQFKREYSECDDFRDAALKRISAEHPALVVTGNLATESVIEDGHRLTGDASADALRDGYVKTLDELRDTGAKVVVMHDNPRPPDDIPSCVSKSMRDLAKCAFSESTALDFEPVNAEAADAVPGVRLIDVAPMLCRDGTCPAVIGNVLVYRNDAHLTATYVRTLTTWLSHQLPTVT